MSDLAIEFPTIELDRSTAQGYAECPLRARLRLLHPAPVGEAAVIGAEGHDAISKTVRTYVERDGMMSPTDVKDELLGNLAYSRPDVQPAVLDRFRGGTWAFGQYLANLGAPAILHFDGGDGERCGQLSLDVMDVRLTSEFDLLHLTESPEVLRELDYKSGWRAWDIDAVRNEFQFAVHAAIALEHYPDVERLEIAVFQTGTGQRTPFVAFRRRDLANMTARIRQAVDAWLRFEPEASLIEQVEPWPSAEKCRLCEVARWCYVADRAPREIEDDPGAFIDDMAAVEKRLDAMRETAEAYVAKHGPIVSSGTRFGIDPKYRPRPSMKLTAVKE